MYFASPPALSVSTCLVGGINVEKFFWFLLEELLNQVEAASPVITFLQGKVRAQTHVGSFLFVVVANLLNNTLIESQASYAIIWEVHVTRVSR